MIGFTIRHADCRIFIKFTFRNLEKGVQELHRKFVVTPADKAANNVVVVWKMYYINTLKQELSTAKTFEHNLLDDRAVIDRHCASFHPQQPPHPPPPSGSAAVCSKVVVMLCLIHCPHCFVGVLCLFFVLLFSTVCPPVLQSSWWGRESQLLYFICLTNVLWLLGFCSNSSRWRGLVCSVCLRYYLIILTYF